MVLWCYTIRGWLLWHIFLKKTNNKKGTYLQIYSSFYDPERRHTAHKAYKPIGYVHELQAKGIDDPISFYKEEVIRLNQEANAAKAAKKAKQISDDSPEKLIGYFPMKNINDKLSVKKYIDLMQTATDFRFNVFDMISALVYARLFHDLLRIQDQIVDLFTGSQISAVSIHNISPPVREGTAGKFLLPLGQDDFAVLVIIILNDSVDNCYKCK